jgi:uncharacterized membrane protein
MTRRTPDSLSKKIAYIAVAFGIAALVLACVGIGTPRWQSDYYTPGDETYVKTGSANFFYACVAFTNGTVYNCTNRGSSLYGYSNYNPAYPWMTDYNQRMQNAGALCIVGIILLFLGTLMTLMMAIVYFQTWLTLIPPALLFLACLFMLAGMAEGSRYLLYNDYSANLYQTGHLLTMFTLFLSAFAAGRIHFSRWTEAGRTTMQ